MIIYLNIWLVAYSELDMLTIRGICGLLTNLRNMLRRKKECSTRSKLKLMVNKEATSWVFYSKITIWTQLLMYRICHSRSGICCVTAYDKWLCKASPTNSERILIYFNDSTFFENIKQARVKLYLICKMYQPHFYIFRTIH